VEESSRALADEVTARIWPCVELQWEWLGGLPPLRKAAVVGAGSMGTGVAALLARSGLEVQLGCRTAAQAAKVATAERNESYLPSVELPAGVTATSLSEIEFAGVDLVVFAVPSSALPSAVANVGAQIGGRSAVLVVSKGLVAPHGALPSSYVSERVNARAVACLGGPCHAAEAVESGASVVLASRDRDFREQLGEALERAGLEVERSTDVPGVELAGAAKNAAALAAAAAAPSGMNAAGAASARVFAEVQTLAARHGAHPDTFTGLAGTGDLVATVMAGHSRNRRAGELLAAGMSAERIPGVLGEEAEALHSVPLIAALCAREGVKAPATAALADLIEGRVGAAAWVEQLRGGARAAA
jgi:glycerol-3-phosphate dehydrogenase